MNEKKMVETERLEILLNKVKLNGEHIDLNIVQKEIIRSALHCVSYHAPRINGKTVVIAILLKINKEFLKEPLSFKLSSNMVYPNIDYIKHLMKLITFDVKKDYKLDIDTPCTCIILDDDFEFLNNEKYLEKY